MSSNCVSQRFICSQVLFLLLFFLYARIPLICQSSINCTKVGGTI